MGGIFGGGAPAAGAQGRQDFLETPNFIQAPAAVPAGVPEAGAPEAGVRRRGAALSDKPTGLGQAAGGRKTLLGE
jgi:hypothetical protein